MMLQKEKYWLDRIAIDDEKAFRFIFDKYYTLLCSLSFHYTTDYQSSELIVEDVFLALWNRRRDLADIQSLRAYLMMSTRNKSIDYLRCHQTEQSFVSLSDQNNHFQIPDQVIFDHYLFQDSEKNIYQAIERLPEECRTVFCLSRFEDMTYNEIAMRLHISVNTVKYHMKNALALLREYLKEFISITILFLLLRF